MKMMISSMDLDVLFWFLVWTTDMSLDCTTVLFSLDMLSEPVIWTCNLDMLSRPIMLSRPMLLGDFWKRSSFHRINCHYIISEQILGLQLQSLSILHFWKIVSYKADLQATITAIKTPTKPTKQGKINHYLLQLMLWLLSLHCHQCPFFPHVHFLWLPLQ